MPLTDSKLRPQSRPAPFKLADAEGLYVLVATGGSKMWRLAYRFNGKQKILALGHYPDVSLLEARKARVVAKGLVRSGTDPPDDRRAARRRKSIAAANTFEAIANEWFEGNKDRWVETYSSRLRRRLAHHIDRWRNQQDNAIFGQNERPLTTQSGHRSFRCIARRGVAN
jgi:hypothetical protein